MTAITISNTDWSILSAVRSALAGATVQGETVFASVTMTTSADQARRCQLAGAAPKAIVLYEGSSERVGLGGERNCWVSISLLLAARAPAGVDAAGRLQEILRLMNAAINAAEADPPADACPLGTPDLYRPALQWRAADIRINEPDSQGWTLCRLGLEVSYRLNAGTSH